ncbi:MAG TPA: tetratricopeptide repeat protein, partial [Pirellulales bacterium]|nr:tetratricopeptide repeat protein [Pirellulales bacterium]
MTITFPRSIWGRALLAAMVAAALLVMPAVADEPGPDRLAAARKAYLEGKYAEAEEAFRGLGQTPEAVIGQARSQEATGHREKALQIITEGIKSQSKSALLHAESARLAWQGGDQAAAEQAVKQALAIDADQPLARWVQSELCVAGGQLTEASQIYQRIVEYFNQHPVRDPEQLQWIGLAAAEYARWNRLSDQFHFLVNDFYPDLLAIEPQFWRAHYEAGRLFAEKYNFAEAAKEFEAGLVINPQAAEVHAAAGQLALEEFEVKAAAAAADRALEINPQLLEAWHLRADIQFANFEPRAAVGFLNDALKLDPQSEATLGRLAAAYLAVDGLQRTGGETRFGKLASEVEKRNAHAGQFYQALADALDRLRRWPAAARYYQEAITRMPQLVPPRGRLGMMLMRLGEEPQAKQVLAEAFEIDPFNVRVNNTLKVLEVLDGYETLE